MISLLLGPAVGALITMTLLVAFCAPRWMTLTIPAIVFGGNVLYAWALMSP